MAFVAPVSVVASSFEVKAVASRNSCSQGSASAVVSSFAFASGSSSITVGSRPQFFGKVQFIAKDKLAPSAEFKIFASDEERTFVAVKPDGVQRGVVGDIISRFEKKGYKLIALKLLIPTKATAEEHYKFLKEKPFFPGLVDFITSGPIVGMVWQGRNVVATARKLIGATNPLASEPGTIRGDFGVDVGRNVIHGSDTVENAEREIALWFDPEDVYTWTPTNTPWIYE
mmetsp:Transcript_20098/g.34613  ORF Transcript_20098/g.34613 Transcript_20098/m.34613 type:complete len:228 (+) Transcript_20098:49-732(+)|eukprot:CAMPEP_0196657690 /NCGR_PEP_ID=MMETSP1086-20130531/24970_1 /TAXON_ID=77921 /ORGANISM="Cyanoptyche  gloeocystis , Strain SAG4.97" /LENGTH=227 /DNA_ID=CAMNT_0041990923 /DNA_START=47 /DNA_END=730 /DNA_ORIENTATION=+